MSEQVPGTVYVTLKIPYSERASDAYWADAIEQGAEIVFRGLLGAAIVDRVIESGFNLDDIDTESSFEPDEDSEPGEDGGG